MSGGHWDYHQDDLKVILRDVGQDFEVLSRWPETAEAFRRLADILTDVMHDMDWDLSCDNAIKDDSIFDARSIAAIREAVRASGEKPDILRVERLERRVKVLEEKP